MPYSVDGWIEVLWSHTLDEEVQSWEGVVNLSIFDLYGDPISNELFGLAKSPRGDALYPDRGIPEDCCDFVSTAFEDNEKFIQKHGEGEFGHTFALWSEIECYLRKNQFKDQYNEWGLVFDIARKLSKKYNTEWIRFVVWANW